MALIHQICKLYPELEDKDFDIPPMGAGTIELRNDSDGRGDYIHVWNHPTLAEPTEEQLENA